MAVHCLHCDAKIGLFKKPIEGLYCTYDCRNAARDEQERLAREALVLADEQARAREELERGRVNSEVVSKAEAAIKGSCPKCSRQWRHVPGGGALGLDHGDCSYCGFSADFLAIEPCPNCRCQSLVVAAQSEGRCPKCKTRVARQTA